MMVRIEVVPGNYVSELFRLIQIRFCPGVIISLSQRDFGPIFPTPQQLFQTLFSTRPFYPNCRYYKAMFSKYGSIRSIPICPYVFQVSYTLTLVINLSYIALLKIAILITTPYISNSRPCSRFLIRWGYPLANIYITMENHHFVLENSLQMAMFNGYVKLPEGISPYYHIITILSPYSLHILIINHGSSFFRRSIAM